MEKISCINCVTNEEVLYTVKDRNILHTLKKKRNWSHPAQEVPSETCN
jgi:hypothetical protein